MQTTCIRVLLVDSDLASVDFVMAAITDANTRFSLEYTQTLTEATTAVSSGEVDVVLLEPNSVDFGDADTACNKLLFQAKNTAVVVLTGTPDEDAAKNLIRRGVLEYLCKHEICSKQLLLSMRIAVERHQLIQSQCATSRDEIALKPRWNQHSQELSLAGELIKRFRQESPNQTRILAAFEEENWPQAIDDPLPQNTAIDPKERLRATTKALNRRQSSRLIRFSGNGSGRAVQWQLVDAQT